MSYIILYYTILGYCIYVIRLGYTCPLWPSAIRHSVRRSVVTKGGHAHADELAVVMPMKKERRLKVCKPWGCKCARV